MQNEPASPTSDTPTSEGLWFNLRRVRIAFFVVLALAATVRLYKLGEQDYWLDEIHSMTDAAGRRAEYEAVPHGAILPTPARFTDLPSGCNWLTVWRGMEADSHPPVFFMFFHTWRKVFGDGEFTARVPAAMFSVAAIFVVALISRVQNRPREGLWIAVVLALAYSHVFMAQQARPYTLALLFTCGSYWAIAKMAADWSVLSRRQRMLWALLYGAMCYLAVLTHYFAGFALLGHVVVVAVRRDRALMRSWAVAAALALVAFVLTWGQKLVAQWGFIESHIWLLEEHPAHAWRTLLRLTDAPMRLMFAHVPFRSNYLFSLIGLLVVSGCLLLLWRRRARHAVLYAAWYLVPLVTFAIIDLTTDKQTLSHLRYLSVAVPGLAGLLVLTVLELSRPLQRLCLAAFVLVVLVTLRLPTQDNPHNRVASAEIAERLTPDALLVFDATDWQPFWVAQMYHNVACYLPDFVEGPLPECVLLRSEPDAELVEQMVKYPRILVVSPRIGVVPNPVPGRFVPDHRTEHVHQIGKIYLFVRAPDGR